MMKKTVFFLVVLLLIVAIALVGCNKTKSFELTSDSLTIAIGDDVKLPVKISGYKSYTAVSADLDIATIADGYVTGVAEGKTTIDVTAGDTTKTLTVTVVTSYNQEYVQVEFRIPSPKNNANVELFSKTISKKCYTAVIGTGAGCDVPSPSIPDGYAFKGWYLNEDCTLSASFPYNLETNSVIFYGKWIIRDGSEENDVNIQLLYDELDSKTKTATVKGLRYPDVPYETIVIPSTVTISSVQYTVTKIGAGAFDKMPYLTSVKMPSIVDIGESAFESCPNLKTVIADHTLLKSVGKHAFFESGLEELKSIKVASAGDFSIESYGEDAFFGTKYIDGFTRSVRNLEIGGRLTATYLGFLHSGNYIAYDYEYMSDATRFDAGYSKTIALTNLTVNKVSCVFDQDNDIRVLLLGYNTADAERIKDLFVAQGIKAENVEIRA